MSRSLARGVVQTLGGGAAVAAVSLVRNVLIARVMGAAAFGLWNVCLVAQRIAAESHLGALSAVAVASPTRRGTGDLAGAERVERLGATLALLFGGVAGVMAAVVLRAIGGAALGTAAVALAVAVVLQQQFAATATILRARRRFGGLPVGQGLFAALYAAGLVVLLPGRYLTGALVAAVAALAVALVGVRLHTPQAVPLPVVPRLRAARDLVRQGLPVYLVQLTLVLLLQADRVVVGATLGQEALGHYGVLVLAGTGLLFVPDAFSSVLWPIATETFARADRDPAALGAAARAAMRHLTVLLAGALPLTLAGADALVEHVLPHYAPALPALRVYAAGLVPLALSLPLRNLLVTAGAERPLLVAQTSLLAVALLGGAASAAHGGGVLGVAVVSSGVSASLFAVTVALLISRRVLPLRPALADATRAAVALALAVGADRALGGLAPPVSDVTGAVVRVLASGAVAVALALRTGLLLRARPEPD